jgi:magnesium-transporting ATPase (P-type)
MVNLEEINGNLGLVFVFITLFCSLSLCIVSIGRGQFKYFSYLMWTFVFIFLIILIMYVANIDKSSFEQKEIIIFTLLIIGFGSDFYFGKQIYDL